MSAGFCGKSFTDLVNNLSNNDPYMVLADFDSYCEAQKKSSALYGDSLGWNRSSLINIANSGIFSADRAVTEYSRDIWGIKPVI